MNTSLPESVRTALASVSLDDKYTLQHGRAFMSGVQALVRLPLLQRQRDALAGLNTAGFISGYRGSPLGTYDQALWAAKKHLADNHIVFQPGVNEELGATAVWGTQQLDLYPQSKKYDGVFAGGDAVMGARTVVEAVAVAKKVAESMDAYMKSLPAEEAADPYADIPVFQTPTSDVLAKQEI